MKALSIRQPWAWAIMAGHKKIENRTWDTKFRGMFLVHAGLKIDVAGIAFIRRMNLIDQMPVLATGCLLGTVILGSTIKPTPIEQFTGMDPWYRGEFGFLLHTPQPLPASIPYKGRLGFFEVPDEAWRPS